MTTNESTLIIEAAKTIAQEVHQGQKDKSGKDYFASHLTSVAQMGKTWKETVTGYLHDAAEDTSHSEKEIVEWLTSLSNGTLKEEDAREIEEALYLLNSNHYTSREAYIDTIKKSLLAIHVKLNDLKNNMQLSRIATPTGEDYERIDRYRKEYEKVVGYLGGKN